MSKLGSIGGGFRTVAASTRRNEVIADEVKSGSDAVVTMQ